MKCKELVLDRHGFVHLVFELLPAGNLESLARKRKVPFSEHQIRSIFYQLLLATSYMHSANFMHRDIKPENILIQSISQDGEVKIKLADLGLAKRCMPSNTRPHTTYVATRWYRSPEILLRITNYSYPSDLWAVGAVMAELIRLGEPVFPGDDEKDQLQRVIALRGHPSMVGWAKGDLVMRKRRIKFPRVTPSSLRSVIPTASAPVLQLISDLLEMDPQRRPSASEALEYPLFVSESPLRSEIFPVRKRLKLESNERDTARTSEYPSSRLSYRSEEDGEIETHLRDRYQETHKVPKLRHNPKQLAAKEAPSNPALFNIPALSADERPTDSSDVHDHSILGHRRPAGCFDMRVLH